MTHLQSILLGLIQGVTEFFPISSSGHLVLFQTLFGMEAADHIFYNIVVHFATLLAILIYFKADILSLIKGVFAKDKYQLNLAKNIMIATIPVVIIGLLLGDFIGDFFSNYKTVGFMMALTAIFFLLSDKLYHKVIHDFSFSWKQALLIGISQSIAIIPGVSRSGTTLSTGLLLGLDREKSAEFSFLIAIPAISGATVLYLLKLLSNPTPDLLPFSILLSGFLAAFVSGYLSIKFLMQLYKKYSLKAFSVYLLILSVTLLVI